MKIYCKHHIVCILSCLLDCNQNQNHLRSRSCHKMAITMKTSWNFKFFIEKNKIKHKVCVCSILNDVFLLARILSYQNLLICLKVAGGCGRQGRYHDNGLINWRILERQVGIYICTLTTSKHIVSITLYVFWAACFIAIKIGVF